MTFNQFRFVGYGILIGLVLGQIPWGIFAIASQWGAS